MSLFAIWEESQNWGDAVNPILIEALSRKKPVNTSPYLNVKSRLSFYPKSFLRRISRQPVYMACGSILAWADSHTVVWGAGFIRADERLRKEPRKICAVRGPLTREIVLKQGYDCPEVYGDPALLFSQLYPRTPFAKHRLGIIPHFVDYEVAKQLFKGVKDILVINVKSGIFNVVNQILSCELIASSCLHGLVLADSYDIPNLWLKFSDKVIGQGFKFRDYFASVKRPVKEPLVVSEKTRLETVLNRFESCQAIIDFEGLLASCPFYWREENETA